MEKRFQFDQMKENEDFVVLNGRWQQVYPPSMIQHLPIREEKAGGGYILIRAGVFQEESAEVISSLFIELLLASPDRRKQGTGIWYERAWREGVSPH
ncbi:hypothetical protein SAMN05216412_11440 [Nitrosospira multiformis]|uniref:Uncharacterized protein n=1 Tax=Nitrosospira multiformis TaxID=1231 RepID=A0A1I0GPC5_9PROT|nr:hypothetical protein [Nitrosospira multiformis]SET72003.1 hypothetical protein SAMN05216412_11440 [Nitrosospira multiformis]